VTNRLVEQALKKQKTSRTPIWLMRQAGRYLPEYMAVRDKAGDFLGLCYAPDKAAEVTLQPVRRFDMDAAILFSDILVVPHALGQNLSFVHGEGPKLDPVRDAAGFAALKMDRLHDHLAPIYETVKRVRADLSPEKTLIGFAGSPWTVACYMVEGGGSKEFLAVKSMMFGQEQVFAALITLLENATVAYLKEQIKAGVSVVQLFDSWSGVLDPISFEKFVIAPTQRIVAALKAQYPHIPVIGFARGSGVSILRYATQTGVDGLGLDTQFDRVWARDNLQKDFCLQGNLDPAVLRSGGAALDQHIDAVMDDLAGGSFIFNLGHGIIKDTPPEHVAQLVSRVRSHSLQNTSSQCPDQQQNKANAR